MTTALRIALVLVGTGCIAWGIYTWPCVRDGWQRYALAILAIGGAVILGIGVTGRGL